jgi:phosphohistidine phosphatase
MKRLLLLRHAKSSWDEPGLADHDRPLAPRGVRAAKAIAKHLGQEGLAAELVLCSSASRTRETLDVIEPALGDDAEVLVEPELYGASEVALLERVRQIPGTFGSAILIGHNPGIQGLALTLAGRGDRLDELAAKYPTAALATLEFEGDWTDLRPGAAALTAFVKPRDLD